MILLTSLFDRDCLHYIKINKLFNCMSIINSKYYINHRLLVKSDLKFFSEFYIIRMYWIFRVINYST